MTSKVAADAAVMVTQAADDVEPGPGICSSDLNHLHPAVRDLARADDAIRLQAIRSKRWITHPLATRLLATLEETFGQSKGDRMENILLVAESGMGKTMLLRKFQRDHAVPPDTVSGVQRHPVVLTLMPEEPSEEAFYIQVLKAVGAPVVLATRRHRLGMRETTFRLLRELGTQMLMIDEINSVLVGSARQQRYFLQLLRFLSNELQVAIVCAGVPEARFALLSDPQLRSRVADLALEPWTAGPELAAFVALLVQGMPLRQASPPLVFRVLRAQNLDQLRPSTAPSSAACSSNDPAASPCRSAGHWSAPQRPRSTPGRSVSTCLIWTMPRFGADFGYRTAARPGYVRPRWRGHRAEAGAVARLPLAPLPLPDEALSSWIARIAARYDLSADALVRHLLLGEPNVGGIVRYIDDRPCPQLEVALAEAAGQPEMDFAARRLPGLTEHPGVAWPRQQPAWCPICLFEDVAALGEVHARRNWRLGGAAEGSIGGAGGKAAEGVICSAPFMAVFWFPSARAASTGSPTTR